jgi:hypothetical protein
MTMYNVSNCQVPLKVCKCMAMCKLPQNLIFNYPWKYIHIECAYF